MKKLMMLLIVTVLLGVLCLPVLAVEDLVPVVAKVPEGWTNANLYGWNNDSTGSEWTTWPGVAMIQLERDIFCTYMPADVKYIIINDGNGNQSADLAVTVGVPVYVDASDRYEVLISYELPVLVPTAEELGIVYTEEPTMPTGSDWYVAGDFNDWNACDAAFRMDDHGDGTFVLSMDVLEGSHALKVTNGTWDVNYGGDGADGNLEFTTAKGTLTVTFDINTGTITLSGADVEIGMDPPDGPPPDYFTWYVAGDFNNWNPADEAYRMSDGSDGPISLTFPITAGCHSLKVTNGTWDLSYGGDGADGNLDFTTNAGDLTVSFSFITDQITLSGADVVLGHIDTEEEQDDLSEFNWYVAGDFNNWNACDPEYKMNQMVNGEFALTFWLPAGEYTLQVTNGTWENFGGEEYIFTVPIDGNVTVYFDGNTTAVDVPNNTSEEETQTEPT